MANHNFFHWLLTSFYIILNAFPLIGAGVVVFIIGFLIFKNTGEPYDLLFGFPLMLLGISVTIINLYETLAGVFDRQFNRNHCPICNSSTNRL